MNIAVCVKRIPKTAEADIMIEKDGKDIKKDHLVFTLNDWDGYAVREAALLKEKHGGEVTVLTVGPEESKEVLTRCLAMGADRALRIEEPTSIDGHRIAEILSQALKGQPFDLILTGVQAEDDGWGQVGGAHAQMLGLSHAAIVNHIEITEGRASVRRELEGGIEEAVEAKLPAVLTIQTGINEPKYVSLAAILEAARLRLRPILMTSIAFIMGVVPMVFSTGAGAEMRQAMGVAVFAGMIGVTIFGLILTPLFYYVLAKRAARTAAATSQELTHG